MRGHPANELPAVITICPQCQLPLSVTAADLRVAQGQVRCGRCAAVFNALASLHEPGARDAAPPAMDAADRASADRVPQDLNATPESPVVLADPVTDQPLQDATNAGGAADPGANEPGSGGAADLNWEISTMTAAELASLVARADRNELPEFASIQIAIDDASEITVLPGNSASPSALAPAAASIAPAAPDDSANRSASSLRWLELEPAHPAPGSLAASLGVAAESDFGARTGVGRQPDPAPEPLRRNAEPAQPNPWLDLMPPELEVPAIEVPAIDEAALQELEAATPAWRSGAVPRALAAGTALLSVLLCIQLIHVFRDSLVDVPAFEKPLMRLYAAMGRPIAPRWDVARYEVRQQGVVAEPVAAGTLTVRASIRNGASREQPAPLLRVSFQDRFGNRIATRDLTPREYGGLPAAASAPMLAPGQRIDAEVSLRDPGGDAIGFELDVCLRNPDRSIRCANDGLAANS